MRVDFTLVLMADDEARLLAIKVNIPDRKKGQAGENKKKSVRFTRQGSAE